MLALFRIFAVLVVTFLVASSASAQVGANRLPPYPHDPEKDEAPKSLRETLARLRIEQSKKDFDEMLERGEEAVRIVADLERRYMESGRFTSQEYTKVGEVEKLVKKIRGDLGGNDDEGDAENTTGPLSPTDAIKALHSAVESLNDDLKKTSRFTISARAIENTNVILKVARFLRLAN